MSRQERIEIPADSPFFTGHFRGHPIFPGIAHPLLVTRAPVAGIPSLKLRSPVRPGDSLDVAAGDPGEDGTVRFELRRGSEVVSQGVLRLAAADWEGALDLSKPEVSPSGLPPVSTLIPHEPPARLLRDLLEVSAESLTGIAEVPAESPFVTGGRAPAYLGLEAAAQGAAALEALSRNDAPGPRIGYLVGLRNAVLQTPWLPAGQPFRIKVQLTGSAAALSIYDVNVESGTGVKLVTGTISTYIAPQG